MFKEITFKKYNTNMLYFLAVLDFVIIAVVMFILHNYIFCYNEPIMKIISKTIIATASIFFGDVIVSIICTESAKYTNGQVVPFITLFLIVLYNIFFRYILNIVLYFPYKVINYKNIKKNEYNELRDKFVNYKRLN